MMPAAVQIYDVLENTWPAASQCTLGPWTIRDGQGGGKRVSAATATQAVSPKDIPVAEKAMRGLDQTPVFMIREGDEALDNVLAHCGYQVVDPVNIYVSPVAQLTMERPPRVSTFAVWEPLAIMVDIWAAGGIDTDRLAVMNRASGPKTAVFGRNNNRPAAAGFVAIHDGTAMAHAVEVLPEHRREGMGRYLMQEVAFWAAEQGASHISVICRQVNTAANALYASLGMTLVGQYHYRQKG